MEPAVCQDNQRRGAEKRHHAGCSGTAGRGGTARRARMRQPVGDRGDLGVESATRQEGSKMARPSNRQPDELRKIQITRGYTKHAEGSVLVEFGDTKVLCTASVEEKVPGFLRGQGRGWLTSEYGMLPRAADTP